MVFSFPEGLAPEVYPLAWLVGHWQGRGEIAYPGIEARSIVNDVVFSHDGGPYLTYTSTVRVLGTQQETDGAGAGDHAAHADQVPAAGSPTSASDTETVQGEGGATRAGAGDQDQLQGQVWSTETGYWSVSSQRPDYLEEGQHALEVLLANPDGRLMFMDGVCGNGRIDLRSLKIVRSSTGADVTASKRMYGNV